MVSLRIKVGLTTEGKWLFLNKNPLLNDEIKQGIKML
jgi:hypothetical protein